MLNANDVSNAYCISYWESCLLLLICFDDILIFIYLLFFQFLLLNESDKTVQKKRLMNINYNKTYFITVELHSSELVFQKVKQYGSNGPCDSPVESLNMICQL